MRASEGLTDCPGSVWAIIEGASASDRRTRDIQFLFMATPCTENFWRTDPHAFMGCARVHKRGVQLSFGKSWTMRDRRPYSTAILSGERVSANRYSGRCLCAALVQPSHTTFGLGSRS